MATPSTKTPETLAKTTRTRWWLFVAVAFYVASIAATVPPFRGDAVFYVSAALAVRADTGHATPHSGWRVALLPANQGNAARCQHRPGSG